MKKCKPINILFFLMLLLPYATVAQRAGGVLISSENNNEKAHPSAILEVRSESKGMLIPRLSLNERDIKPLTDALTVYVTDVGEKGFWFYDELEEEWIKLLVVDPGSPGMLVPQNGVIMYCGSSKDFDENGKGREGTEMEGWHLCNGHNGTPDLSRKFIVGRDNPTSADFETVGTQAGDPNYTMSEQNMPPHTHLLENSGDISLPHLHTHTPVERGRKTETDPDRYEPSHTHPLPTKSNDPGGVYSRKEPHKDNDETFWNTTSNKANIISIGSADAIVNITIKDEIVGMSSGGTKLLIDNRPLYYVLAFIIRNNNFEENP
jgi:hypothetical protein